jgi:hypothetical protein
MICLIFQHTYCQAELTGVGVWSWRIPYGRFSCLRMAKGWGNGALLSKTLKQAKVKQ